MCSAVGVFSGASFRRFVVTLVRLPRWGILALACLAAAPTVPAETTTFTLTGPLTVQVSNTTVNCTPIVTPSQSGGSLTFTYKVTCADGASASGTGQAQFPASITGDKSVAQLQGTSFSLSGALSATLSPSADLLSSGVYVHFYDESAISDPNPSCVGTGQAVNRSGGTSSVSVTCPFTPSRVLRLASSVSPLKLIFDSSVQLRTQQYFGIMVTASYTSTPAGSGGPDQISFIDDTFSPPLDQPFEAGKPSGPMTFKVAYSLNSLASGALIVFVAEIDPAKTVVPVQRGSGVVSVTLDSRVPEGGGIPIIARLSDSPTSGKLLSDDADRSYRVTPPASNDLIQILNPAPSPGSPAPTTPQDISATCIPQLKNGTTRYFALRIFDPDSPIAALLGTSGFQKGTDQQAGKLTISGFSVKPGDMTLGRMALNCTLYDTTQTQVVAESGSYVYAIPSSVTGNPAITPGGVVDAARGRALVSRGGLASIYGTNLATSTNKPRVTPVSKYLGGVQVSVGGINAPLLFISPKQINFQVPYEAPVSSGVPVIVTRDGVVSSTVTVAVADYAPAVFVYGTAPDPIAVHVNGALITAANPAVAGEVIVVYGTGVGNVSHQPSTGGGAFSGIGGDGLDSPPKATVTPTITVGGSNAQVLYAGLTVGFVGLAQFNIQLPNPLPGGSSLPLLISFGSASSQPVNLAVR